MNKSVLLVVTLLIAQSPAGAMADSTANDVETDFFRAIGIGDAETPLRLLHPDIQKLVDRPVLQAWANAVRDNLGQHNSTLHTDRKQTQRLTAKEVQLTSEVRFEKGTAHSSMTILNGQIIAFQVKSELLQNWFQGPATTDMYEERAQAFINAFFSSNDETAFAMMHPALQKAVPRQKLNQMMETVAANGGNLKQQQLRGSRFSLDGTSPALFLTFEIDCEHASGECEVEFQFDGMKGYLLGFDFR